MATLASLMVKLGLDPKEFGKGVNNTRTWLKQMRADVQTTHDRLAKMETPLRALGKISTFAVLAQAAAAVKSAIAPVGGALAALPAAAGVGAGALATVKIATTGVSDAMAALASGDAQAAREALANLSPAAADFATEMHGVSDSFVPIRKSIQERFFDSLGDQVAGLATRYLPVLDKGLGAVAGSLNGLAREAITAADTDMMRGITADVLARTAGVFDLFKPAIGPMVGALGQATKAGMPLVEQFGAWAATGLQAKAGFLASAEGATWLEQKVAAAQKTIGLLVSIAGNIRETLAGIFRPAAGEGGNLLVVVDGLTQRMATWVNSAAGQEKIAQVFALIRDVASNVVDILPLMVGPLTTVAGLISKMDPQTAALVASVLAWSMVLSPIAGKLTAVATAAVTLGKGVVEAGKFTASVWRIVTASTAAQASTAKASAGIVARMTAVAVSGTISAAKTVASWVAMGATATVNAAKVVAGWVVSAAGAVASGAVMLASMVATAAGVVAGWVMMGVQSLIQAARMAAAWLIAMGPIGWVIAAVIGLVALIIAYWDEIVAFTKAAWDKIWGWIKAAADFVWNLFLNWSLPGLIIKYWDEIVAWTKAAWDKIWGWIKEKAQAIADWVRQKIDQAMAAWEIMKSIPGKIADWFGAAKDWAVRKLGELVDWLGGLPGRILDSLGNLGSLLVNAGRDIIDGLIRGIQGAFNKVRDLLGSLTDMLPDWKGPAVVDARILTPSGRLVMESLVDGFRRGMPEVERYLGGVTDRIGVLEVPAPRVPGLAMADGRTADTADTATSDRPLLNIENYHPPADASAHDVAVDLDWEMRKAGR